MDAQPVLQVLESAVENAGTALELVESGLGTVVTEAVTLANTITVNKTAAAFVVSGLSLASGGVGFKLGYRSATKRYHEKVAEAVLAPVEAQPEPASVQVSPDVKVGPKAAFVPRAGVGPLGNRIAQ